MNRIPPQVRAALITMVTPLLAQYGAGSAEIENGVSALLASANGKAKHDREPDRMLTSKEAATMLRRSTKTLRELAKRGKIRRIFCGANCERSSGYSQKSIEQFLAGKEAV